VEQKRKQKFFDESGNENETTFSGETDAEQKLPFSTNMKFLFMVVLMANFAGPMHDLGGLLVPTIICFSSASAPYLFHIYFRNYLLSYLFSYLFLLPHKNMKTNMAALSSRSIFIWLHI
jgi:hypothetical protein